MYTQIGLVKAAIMSISYEHDAAAHVTKLLSITTFKN